MTLVNTWTIGAACYGVGVACDHLGTATETQIGIKFIACGLSAVCFATGFVQASKDTYKVAQVAAPIIGKSLKVVGKILTRNPL
jgi:hypothetical protein